MTTQRGRRWLDEAVSPSRLAVALGILAICLVINFTTQDAEPASVGFAVFAGGNYVSATVVGWLASRSGRRSVPFWFVLAYLGATLLVIARILES